MNDGRRINRGQTWLANPTHSAAFKPCQTMTQPSGNPNVSKDNIQQESLNMCFFTIWSHPSLLLSPVICVSMTACRPWQICVWSLMCTDVHWRHLGFRKEMPDVFFCLLFLKDAAASYDFNDNDPDPFPRYDSTNENKWVNCWEATFGHFSWLLQDAF